MAVACLLLAAACEHDSGDTAGQVEIRNPGQLAEEILRLELEAQALRPMARALAGRSFGEDSIDALESHLAVTASLLLANEGQPEGEVRTAIEIGLSAAGLYYDLMRTDLEAAARGMRAVTRLNCNRGVEETGTIRVNMARDWRWVITHRTEAEQALANAERYRDNVMAAMPLANVMKAGVGAASMTSSALSLVSLVKIGRPAFAPVIQWFKAGGFQGARLELAGVGAGLGIQAVAGAQVLVLSDATVIALAQAGLISANSVALLYLARGHLHHICTDKNFESATRGGPWSPVFKKYLDGAKLRFNSPENLVKVKGHKGPHPKAYHNEVLSKLREETQGTVPGSAAYREGVLRALRSLADQIKKPGTRLNQLVTGSSR